MNTTPRDLLAEGRALRAAADLEQSAVAPSEPWPATTAWFIWTRNHTGILLDTIDAIMSTDPDLFDKERIDPEDGWEYDLSETAYETYGGVGRQLRDSILTILDTPKETANAR